MPTSVAQISENDDIDPNSLIFEIYIDKKK